MNPSYPRAVAEQQGTSMFEMLLVRGTTVKEEYIGSCRSNTIAGFVSPSSSALGPPSMASKIPAHVLPTEHEPNASDSMHGPRDALTSA